MAADAGIVKITCNSSSMIYNGILCMVKSDLDDHQEEIFGPVDELLSDEGERNDRRRV